MDRPSSFSRSQLPCFGFVLPDLRLLSQHGDHGIEAAVVIQIRNRESAMRRGSADLLRGDEGPLPVQEHRIGLEVMLVANALDLSVT